MSDYNKHLGIRVDKHTYEKLEEIIELQDKSQSEFLRDIINRAVDGNYSKKQLKNKKERLIEKIESVEDKINTIEEKQVKEKRELKDYKQLIIDHLYKFYSQNNKKLTKRNIDILLDQFFTPDFWAGDENFKNIYIDDREKFRDLLDNDYRQVKSKDEVEDLVDLIIEEKIIGCDLNE